MEPIGPIGFNRTYRANWAHLTNWPSWHQFIGKYRANWARGTNWPNWQNSFGHIAPIGPMEPICPIGINRTYRAN